MFSGAGGDDGVKRYTVSVRRSRRDSGAARSRFVVEGADSEYLIDLLGRIERNHDPDFTYRHSCHHGSCGTCTVELNGSPVLACVTRLGSLETTNLEVGPLEHFPTLADVAIDPAELFADIPEDSPYLTPIDSRPEQLVSDENGGGAIPEPPEEVREFHRFENCIECGACVSACPVSESFIGPAVSAAIARELAKGSGRTDLLLRLAAGSRGVDGCIQAFECSRVCPTGVYPSRKIVDLRKLLDSR